MASLVARAVVSVSASPVEHVLVVVARQIQQGVDAVLPTQHLVLGR
ncbi:hypothetical protein ACFXNW_18220 [Nocardia sp. NPDC059180]